MSRQRGVVGKLLTTAFTLWVGNGLGSSPVNFYSVGRLFCADTNKIANKRSYEYVGKRSIHGGYLSKTPFSFFRYLHLFIWIELMNNPWYFSLTKIQKKFL